MRATRDASRPRVWPDASTTNHLRAISPLGKYVDIVNSPEFRKSRERAAEFGRGTRKEPLGVQTQDYQSLKNNGINSPVSILMRHSSSLEQRNWPLPVGISCGN